MSSLDASNDVLRAWPFEPCAQERSRIAALEAENAHLRSENAVLRSTIAKGVAAFQTPPMIITADRSDLEAEVARLREALKPFAEEWTGEWVKQWEATGKDDEVAIGVGTDDLRRARAALTPPEGA
jgi:hypothetical protein